MTQIRCRTCTAFYDKKAAECPGCKTARPGVNSALVNARWESNLNAQATHAVTHG